MAWIMLLASGVLEAVWATALSASKNFSRRRPTILFVVAMAASMIGLALAMEAIPVGTAYAVWVGIGAVLTVVIAAVRGEEKLTLVRAALLSGLVGCVIGLKVVS